MYTKLDTVKFGVQKSAPRIVHDIIQKKKKKKEKQTHEITAPKYLLILENKEEKVIKEAESVSFPFKEKRELRTKSLNLEVLPEIENSLQEPCNTIVVWTY